MLTAVPNFAFAAIWVAEQLKYFEQEGVRIKITPAPSGSVCLNAVVGRSTNFCASTSEGLVLARVEGAPAIAIQAHNRTMTLGVTLRKAIVDKLGLTRESPIQSAAQSTDPVGHHRRDGSRRRLRTGHKISREKSRRIRDRA